MDLGYYHPQLVHFAIAMCGLGVAFRLASLTGRLQWTGPTASVLLIAGGLVTWATARSGHDAHGPVERIPGVVAAVQEHEELGDRTRNMFLVVAGLEVLGLVIRQARANRAIRLVSALAGVGGLVVLYEAAEHGGELVYRFAGGPGLRSGDTTDVTRLLVAGLYARAMADRAAGDKAGAARLIDELYRRMPGDKGVQLTAIESQLKDQGDGIGALLALKAFDPGDDRRSRSRRVFLLSDAYRAIGAVDSARAVLEAYKKENPAAAARVDAALEALSKPQ